MSTVDKELGFAELAEQLSTVHGIRQWGRVIQVVGNLIEADAPTATLGAFAKVRRLPVCEVVGFRANRTLLIMPFDEIRDVQLGDRVEFTRGLLSIPVGEDLLGRVIDPLGRPMDDKPIPIGLHSRPLKRTLPNPMKRQLINKALYTGVRVMDTMLTLGKVNVLQLWLVLGLGSQR